MILMDDAERDGERKIIERWKNEFSTRAEEFTTSTGNHAVLKFDNQT
jgi:hypothetical protein